MIESQKHKTKSTRVVKQQQREVIKYVHLTVCATSQSTTPTNSRPIRREQKFKNSTWTSPWRRADVGGGFGLKNTAGPRSVRARVCDGGWGLHLLPLSCCQAGVQPTAPGLKPSLRQARTTREGRNELKRGEEEEENRRRG